MRAARDTSGESAADAGAADPTDVVDPGAADRGVDVATSATATAAAATPMPAPVDHLHEGLLVTGQRSADQFRV